ncbi:unnamed protein product [Thlaspi arvense]|uniref:TraB family protein n=1 Tax=Thlaspi arvense TaxID=13288 RepID=A0AAU9RFF0_THLAR|nr:unnamed protein product [Thlaspi arvense]
MEPTTQSQSPSEPEPDVHSGEDFVHIEDSRPTGGMSLSDSIVNVEKEDLLDEAEAEEDYKDSDSVVSGGASAGGDGDGIGAETDDGECSSETKKVELPEELTKSVVILTCESTVEGGSCDVYLIGTAHVSKLNCMSNSEKAIKAFAHMSIEGVNVGTALMVVAEEFPKIELGLRGFSCLRGVVFKPIVSSQTSDSEGSNHVGHDRKLEAETEYIRNTLWMIASQLEVFPGSEFRVAYEEALKYGGKVILGDRPVQLKELDNVDMVTLVIQEMSKEFPSLMDTLVHERDQYMASTLLRVASEHSSVVAVIGRGHINGIKKNWKQPITMIDLMEIPSDESVFTVKRILSTVAIAVAGTAIVSGIFLARRR